MVEVVGHNIHYSYFLFLLLVSECKNNHLIHMYLEFWLFEMLRHWWFVGRLLGLYLKQKKSHVV